MTARVPPPFKVDYRRRSCGQFIGVLVTGCRASLEQVEVENLRGFRRVTLSLDRRSVFLVGPNNSGKTSLLRVLDWVMNGVDASLLAGGRRLSRLEEELLLPAADTTGRARRVSLFVRLSDLRVARKYQAEGGLARLRLKVVDGAVSAHLGRPTRGEPSKSEPRAVELLQLLRESEQFIYVPNVRDTQSGPFQKRLRDLVVERLTPALLQAPGARANKTVKSVRDSLDNLRDTAEAQVKDLVEGFSRESTHLFDEARLSLTISPERALEWLADAAALRITTGAHDQRMVPVREVGSGLQSLLMIGLVRSLARPEARVRLLLEEPETFLHPAAQRELARSLLDAEDVWFVASTHSAAMLDEASLGDVVILRDHRIYAVRSRQDQVDRDSTFMSGQAAEALFARSVLLVEGQGDLAVFEQWRRRLGQLPHLRRACSQLAVVQVGGKTAFSPWIRLFRGFVDQERRSAISWLALGDGDAFRQIVSSLNKANIEVSEQLRALGTTVDETYASRDVEGHEHSVAAFNSAALSGNLPMALLPFDLEFAIASRVSEARAAKLATLAQTDATTGLDLARKLGSKFAESERRPSKAEWVRGQIAQLAALDDMHPELQQVLARWLAPVDPNLGQLPRLAARVD